jgi:hypothetical protein|tara:strand:+ start:2261 stop:2587 length:327 start_codon:yes stop_codon:yes gene_type:complete
MDTKQSHGVPFQGTHTHATAATKEIAAVTGKRHYVTDFTIATDKDGAVFTIKDGSTTIWQGIIEIGAGGTSVVTHSFQTPIRGSSGAAITIAVDGTSRADVNISGFTY